MEKLQITLEQFVEILVQLYNRTASDSDVTTYYHHQTAFDEYVDYTCFDALIEPSELSQSEIEEMAFNYAEYDSGLEFED